MNGRAADTSVLVDFLRNDPHAVQLIGDGANLYIPIAAAGELLYGAQKSRNRTRDVSNVREFLAQFKLLPLTAEVAEKYAVIKTELATCGKQIPENDTWIAACALTNKLPLMTFDQHFKRIARLEVID
ncbi:MAG: PIN domain-containing protein [Coriobacteriia bacterium]|nr:PIN domain-containing protein [Coriobacteriia bacterium]